jgi:DNA polymerase III delta prime subunit
MGEIGGFYEIASGEQTGQSVRHVLEMCANIPMYGSGWKVVIVNEADEMSRNAAFVWLDALEHLPPHTIVIFTTNEPKSLPARFRDRCEHLAFSGGSELLPEARALAAEILKREGVPEADIPADDLLEEGTVSFRRAINAAAKRLQRQPEPAVSAGKGWWANE